jgi:hypothetical protein
MFPPQVLKSVAIYHLATTAGQSQGFSSGGTITAAFLPMDDRAHALQGGDFVDPHEVYADAGADIRVGDKLVIDDVTYYARKVFSAPFGRLRHQRVSISRDSHA